MPGHSKMTIRQACAVMSFPAPPVDKKQLRAVFLKLTKVYHPDQQGPKASAEKMIELTEAYRLLRGLIEQRVGGGRRGATGDQQRPGAAADVNAQQASIGFQSAGFGASSDGLWLPWQREPMTTTKKHDEELLTASRGRSANTAQTLVDGRGFRQYAAAVREAESRQHEARRRSQQAGAGSHGFDAAHLEQQRRLRKQQRSFFAATFYDVGDVNLASHTSLSVLAWRYAYLRIQQLPKKMLRNARFIVLGR